MKDCKKITHKSGNKPNFGKPNQYANLMNCFGSNIFEEFNIKVRPPLSVVLEVITNSQEIEVFCKEMKQLTACEEDFEDINHLSSRMFGLRQVNDELFWKILPTDV